MKVGLNPAEKEIFFMDYVQQRASFAIVVQIRERYIFAESRPSVRYKKV